MKVKIRDLQKTIADLEAKIKPLREELDGLYKSQAEATGHRIIMAKGGHGNFSEEELVYAATARCECGAGMAYPTDIDPNGAWYCSDILKGVADKTKVHSRPMAFYMYEVKSEHQSSAEGKTTRPTV